MIAVRIAALVATLWAGSAWTIGYVVAPTLFALLPDRPTAGTLAGALFRNQAWIALACGIVLLILMRINKDLGGGSRRVIFRVVILMLLCVGVGYFGLQPYMAQLRSLAAGTGVMEGALRTQFALTHGVSSALYFVQSVLAGVLIWKLR